MLNGYCRWIWQDGLMYIGQTKNSKFHGPGEMTMGQSQWDIRQVGIWKNGKLQPGKKNEDGRIEIISMQ